MKRVFCLVLFASFAVAAHYASAQTSAGVTSQAAAQAQTTTIVPVALSKSADSKKLKVGDEVTAKVTDDVRTSDGIVIPRDSKLIGKVTQASARSKGDGTSSLALSFDRAELKNGTTLTLVSTVQAVVAPPPPPPMASSEPMGGDTSGGSPSRGGYGGAAPAPASGGPIGSVGSTAGGVAGDVTNTAGSAAGSTAGGVTHAAGSGPVITAGTTGVVGVKNVQLETNSSANAAVLTSSDKSVKLDSGTRLLLNVSSATTATPSEKK